MKGTYVAPVRLTYSRLAACAAYWKAFDDMGLRPTVPFVSVLVAHGALECGNFKEGLWNNNTGNIKTGSKWTGSYTCILLNEREKRNGKWQDIWYSPEGELTSRRGVLVRPAVAVPPGDPQTRMRAFATLDDALEDKLKFLLQKDWRHCLEPAKQGATSAYVRAIRAKNYFTASAEIPLDELTPYESSVVSLVNTYRPVVQQVADGLRPPPEQKPEVLPLMAIPEKLSTEDAIRLAAVIAQQHLIDDIGIVRSESLRNDYRLEDPDADIRKR